jgi:hypothetical protein
VRSKAGYSLGDVFISLALVFPCQRKESMAAEDEVKSSQRLLLFAVMGYDVPIPGEGHIAMIPVLILTAFLFLLIRHISTAEKGC